MAKKIGTSTGAWGKWKPEACCNPEGQWEEGQELV